MLTRTFKSSPGALNALVLLTWVLALESYASNNASTAASDWPKLRADAAVHLSAQPVRHVLQHDGIARRYFLVTPPRSEDQLLALVIVLHGGVGNALNIMQVNGLAAEALAGRSGTRSRRGSGWGLRYGHVQRRHAGASDGLLLPQRIAAIAPVTGGRPIRRCMGWPPERGSARAYRWLQDVQRRFSCGGL